MVDTISPIDHVELALERPSFKLKNAENFLKLVEIFVEKSQEIEDAFLDLADQKDLDTVEGVWLDYIGKIVGEERVGRDDDTYRQAIQLKIGINKSDGTPDVISELIQTYTKADRIRLIEGRWAWGQVIVTSPESINNTAHKLLEDIRPVATRMFLLSDVNDGAFYPAWEVSVSALSLFEVFDGSVTETLELVLDDIGNIGNLYVNETGGGYNYLQGTAGRQFLEWEQPTDFEVFNGTGVIPFEVQLTPTVSEQLIVEGVENATTGEVTLAWEVDETHTGTVVTI